MGNCVCSLTKKPRITGKTFLESSKTAFTHRNNIKETVKLEEDLDIEEKKHIKRIINIAVLGDSGVGKSSCIIKYVHNKFEKYNIVSISTELYEKEIVLKNSIIKLNFLVEASDKQYKSDGEKLTELADIIIYIFDFSKRTSYEYIVKQLEDSINSTSKKYVVIGNKLDLWNKEVPPTESRLFFSNLPVEYLEISTKSFTCLEKMFNSLFEKLLFQ